MKILIDDVGVSNATLRVYEWGQRRKVHRLQKAANCTNRSFDEPKPTKKDFRASRKEKKEIGAAAKSLKVALAAIYKQQTAIEALSTAKPGAMGQFIDTLCLEAEGIDMLSTSCTAIVTSDATAKAHIYCMKVVNEAIP